MSCYLVIFLVLKMKIYSLTVNHKEETVNTLYINTHPEFTGSSNGVVPSLLLAPLGVFSLSLVSKSTVCVLEMSNVYLCVCSCVCVRTFTYVWFTGSATVSSSATGEIENLLLLFLSGHSNLVFTLRGKVTLRKCFLIIIIIG